MSKYLNFINSENGVQQIFTREKIKKMSSNEFQKHEKRIFAQLYSVGIPSNRELISRNKNESYIWCTARDNKVCPKCLSMEGKIFKNLEDIPDDMHPNCRCYIKKIDLMDT